MKILLYTHFYYPEVGAASIRMQYFVAALRNAGNEVKVVAPRPNYPQGKVYEGYNKFYFNDIENNVVYLPVYSSKKFSVLKRALTYISYLVSSIIYNIFNTYKPDVIISSSPPVPTTFAAVLVSKIKRRPIILDIRDLWPDIGIELGIIKSDFLIKLFKKVDHFILKNSDQISVPLEGFMDVFIRKGVPEDNITVIYNGADINIFKPKNAIEKNKTREQFNLPCDKKIVVYFGFFNFGMNDIETLNKAFLLLADKKDDIHILLLGDGAQRESFISSLEGKIGFTYIPPQPQNKVAEIISACDLSVVPLKKVENNTGGFIPVKCLESWASGVPVIMSINKDVVIEKMFNKSNAGTIVSAGDEVLLAEGIINVLLNQNTIELGMNGRNYVTSRFNRIAESNKLNSIIEKYI